MEIYMQPMVDDKLDSIKYYTRKDQKFSIDRPFLIPNSKFCVDEKPYLLILVPSKIDNFEERKAIRATYGSMSSDRESRFYGANVDHVVKVMFILGASDNLLDKYKLWHEYEENGDTVQIDVQETYYNLCFKMLYAFRWVNTYCNDVTYVLKSDDDTFVHIGVLLKVLIARKPHENGSIYGKIYNKTQYLDVQKGDNKWKVLDSEYPLRKYPAYMQGSSYTLTANLIPKILETAIFLPYLHVEDVFLTGIIGGHILGAELVELNKTSDWTTEVPDPCLFAMSKRVSQSNMSPDFMYQTWDAITINSLQCNESMYSEDVLNAP
ncbi:Beta-1 [Mactra antiquata]